MVVHNIIHLNTGARISVLRMGIESNDAGFHYLEAVTFSKRLAINIRIS